MNRRDVALAVAAARDDAVVVTSAGANSGYIYEEADRPATLYQMELFYATSTALGIALACPQRQVLSIEGEGSFCGELPVLSTIRRTAPANLVVLVTDNQVWGTGDGQVPTGTRFGIDIVAAAIALGWPANRARRVGAEGLAEQLRAALAEVGPVLLVAEIEHDESARSSPTRLRPRRHLLDCAALVRAELTGTWESG